MVIMLVIEIQDQKGGDMRNYPCKSCANGKQTGRKIIIKTETKGEWRSLVMMQAMCVRFVATGAVPC
jgi:hypothetical protein